MANVRYIFKPILLFFAALVINFTLHELAHALAAYLLGIKSVMHQLSVSFDRDAANRTQQIIIALTGPIFSLCLGLSFLLVYRNISSASAKLFALYGSIFGVSIFLGNLFATSLGGDLHLVAKALNLSQPAIYALSFTGLALMCVFMYTMAGQFMTFTVPDVTRARLILLTILLPWIVGTALTIVVYLPMSLSAIQNRVSESIFWIFTLVGAFISKNKINAGNRIITPVDWVDIGMVVSLILIVRLMARGINFIP